MSSDWAAVTVLVVLTTTTTTTTTTEIDYCKEECSDTSDREVENDARNKHYLQ